LDYQLARIELMDNVAKKNLIKPETRKIHLENEIVLFAPNDSKIEAEDRPYFAACSSASYPRFSEPVEGLHALLT
jgi:ABC-type molybdate transport system substrate-binding protein